MNKKNRVIFPERQETSDPCIGPGDDLEWSDWFVYDADDVDKWFKRCIAEFPLDFTKTHTLGRRHWEFYCWFNKYLLQFKEKEEDE